MRAATNAAVLADPQGFGLATVFDISQTEATAAREAVAA
jgi:hypothetical protein